MFHNEVFFYPVFIPRQQLRCFRLKHHLFNVAGSKFNFFAAIASQKVVPILGQEAIVGDF